MLNEIAVNPSRRRQLGSIGLTFIAVACLSGADGRAELFVDAILAQIERFVRLIGRWYIETPATERAIWAGLGAAAAAAVIVAIGRSVRVRQSRVIPPSFRARLLERLADLTLDQEKSRDYCELNPSPAARVALGAINRWGQPSPNLDRAVQVATQTETAALRRHVGTLRRIAVLLPLLGLLGSLTVASRTLAAIPSGGAIGPAVASALTPLTFSVAMAIVSLVLYDGLTTRIEALSESLERVGSETVDAIMAQTNRTGLVSPSAVPGTHMQRTRRRRVGGARIDYAASADPVEIPLDAD